VLAEDILDDIRQEHIANDRLRRRGFRKRLHEGTHYGYNRDRVRQR
jgi:hypothetical protein